MISKRELQDAIQECERAPVNYQNCEKLATFYTIHDHLFSEVKPSVQMVEETKIGDYGESDFLLAVRDKSAPDIWLLMDELMTTLQVVNPRLYDSVMRQLNN